MYQFTPHAQFMMALARKVSIRLDHQFVGSEHLLLGLIELGQGGGASLLHQLGVDLDTVRFRVEQLLTNGSDPDEKAMGPILFTQRTKKVIAFAQKEAQAMNQSALGTEHLLLGLLREGEGPAARVLLGLGLNLERTRNAVLKRLDPNFIPPDDLQRGALQDGKSTPLRAFGRDLTELVRDGRLSPVEGYAVEIERLIQVLCRCSKNNAVLIAQSSDARTAIVVGLAQHIAAGDVPDDLREKRIVLLDLAFLVMSTKRREEFDDWIQAVMDEIHRTKDVILFIDELPTVLGAGLAEDALDASGFFTPALHRGEIQWIGGTGPAEFRKYIEPSAALGRHFQSMGVVVPEARDAVAFDRLSKGLESEIEGLRLKTWNELRGKYDPPLFLVLAQEEATRLKHDYVGTGHLLLGLLRFTHGGAMKMLQKLNLATPDAIRTEVVRLLSLAPEGKGSGDYPYTSGLWRVLLHAAREGRSPYNAFVGSEYFLIALLQEGEGTAAQALRNLGFTAVKLRKGLRSPG